MTQETKYFFLHLDSDGIGVNFTEALISFIGGETVPATPEQAQKLPQRFKADGGLPVERFQDLTDEQVLAAVAQERSLMNDTREILAQAGDPSSLTAWRDLYLSRLFDHAQKLIDRTKQSVAQYELETWDVQREEYIRYMANNSAPTPYADTLALVRGLERAELMRRIGAKIAGMAYIQGKQHVVEDALWAATTAEEIRAVNVYFSL